MRLVVRPQFYLDIEEEVLWLLEHLGGELAQRWHDAVWKTTQFLTKHPFIGRERLDIKHPGVRSWRFTNFRRWLIFYGVRESDILYRVRSGTMNLAKLEMKS